MEVQSPDPQYADQLQGKFRANDKKFICNYLPDCKAAFSRQEHLQRHIRKHTGERPFSCPCGRTFTRLDNLRQHAQTVHSGTEMAKISEEQNAIAAATKLRPTPNSPPPPRRLAGEGSDTDPYPRPVTKVAKVKAARVKSESPVPPTAINSAASSPAAAAASSSMVPVAPAASAASASAATPAPIRGQVGLNPYDGMTFMHTPLDTTTATTNHHHQHPAYESPHHTPYSTPTQNYTTFPGLPHYGNANHYMPHHHHHQQQQQSQQQQQVQQQQRQQQQQQQQPDVESSVGSQPISSLVKRRAPKNDFVYTGGHMLNSPGLTIHSGSTDFDFTRSTSDTTPDEGEQMSEYINNGLEPKISTTTAVVATTTTATEAVPSTTTTTTSRDIGSHGDVPGILLHFACQNPDL